MPRLTRTGLSVNFNFKYNRILALLPACNMEPFLVSAPFRLSFASQHLHISDNPMEISLLGSILFAQRFDAIGPIIAAL